MRIGGLTIFAALFLAACGAEAPVQQTEAQLAVTEHELPVMGPERRILAFGNSLFTGYNLEQGEGYPERLEAALRGRGINARIINAGVSGDTSAAGLGRIEFVLDNEAAVPDLAIVELGGNDLLRGIAPAETRVNLAAIITELQERDIPVLLMGMRAPPNLGEAFVNDFDSIYPDLAQRYGTALVPFFMGPVFDRPNMMQGDRIHPTALGIDAMVAATLDDVAAALPPPAVR